MHGAVTLSIAEWPDKIGIDWYAVGGTFGLTTLFLAVLLAVRFISTRHSNND